MAPSSRARRVIPDASFPALLSSTKPLPSLSVHAGERAKLASTSSNALKVYKQLLGLARRLPLEKQTAALAQIREGFRQNAGETDSER